MGKADPKNEGGSHASTLRTLIASEQDQRPDLIRLVHALSALFPRGGQDDRKLDAMLLGVPR